MLDYSLHDYVVQLKKQYDVICEINCDYDNIETVRLDLYAKILAVHRSHYYDNQRLIFTIKQDFYHKDSLHGVVFDLLQSILNDIDIANFFVCVVTTNVDAVQEYQIIHQKHTQDFNPVNLYICNGPYVKNLVNQPYFVGKLQSVKDILPTIENLNHDQKQKLFVSKSFCIMPWVGVYVGPNSQVHPCCESKLVMGQATNQTLDNIWNSPQAAQLRTQLLSDQQPATCQACYTKESLGRDSLRQSVNRDFAHCIDLVDIASTLPFSPKYWDIRYNNLCNFACRSCDPDNSSAWYQVHNTINPKQPSKTVYLEAGNNQDNIYEQIVQHADQVEKIYFAGGEPSMIENFYRILELLDRKQRYDVKLIYNINLSRLTLKHWNLAKMWQLFPNVSIGASLDAEGQRAEYLRSGTVWKDIVANRKTLQQACPHIDFYVSATTGLINALHVPDFHRSWTEQGLITAEQFNIQLLLHPSWMSITHAPESLKNKVIQKYQQHLEWLRPHDSLGRSTSGYSSIIELCKDQNRYDSKKFWHNITKLDQYHNTTLFDSFPELIDIGL